MTGFSDTAPVYTPPQTPLFPCLYQDSDILVFDKPCGLLSVPGRHPALADSLLTRVQKEFPEARIIHRLDLDTSGLVIMSLHRKAHACIAAQFEARTARKTYLAEVWGHMPDTEGEVNLPLALDPDNKPRHRVDFENGKAARTRWRVLGKTDDTTRLHLFPLTGRTHQLRVHMQALGHVILGDRFYASGDALAVSPRLMLHAQELCFRHPNGKDLPLTAPAPF